MEEIKVSIIMPVYNCEKYVEDTLVSILKQSYNNYELIIVDDGSTDSSMDIVKRYSEMDKRICVYNQRNQGPAIARNKGMLHARGDYFIFFDSDDIMLDNAIYNMVEVMESEKADLVIGDYLFWMVYLQDKIIEEKGTAFHLCGSTYSEVSLFQPFLMNKMYRAALIREHKIEFTNSFRGEDLNFYLKYILFTDNISLLNKQVLKYRWSENSLSKAPSADKMLDILKSFQDVKDFYTQHGKKELYDLYIYPLELIHFNFAITRVVRINKKKERYKLVLGIRDSLGKKAYYRLDKCGKVFYSTCRKIIRRRLLYCTDWYCNLIRYIQGKILKANK